jgi:ribulose-5-phosphate 4-epimerase/fuculose-1-phosphate aldolase
MEVGWDGQVLAGDGEVEQSAYAIHAPIHRLVPAHACVLHTHMPYASAISRLEEQEILAIGQTEIGFLDKVAYDHTYTGPALDPTEGERLAGILGPDKKVLFMANHGVCVCGGSVAEAYDLLYYLERACQVQLYAMWTGRRLRHVKPEVVEQTLHIYDTAWPGYQGKAPYQHHFDALKRQLDRKEPDYQD